MSDTVEHPSHYTAHPSGVECITVTEHMNFCRGNAIKYLWRAGEKGSELEDLRKARWYIDREIARLEGRGQEDGGTVSQRESVASGQVDPNAGPWPSWQDVPDGVKYRDHGDNTGFAGWVNRNGRRHRVHDGASSKDPEFEMVRCAPFVRVVSA